MAHLPVLHLAPPPRILRGRSGSIIVTIMKLALTAVILVLVATGCARDPGLVGVAGMREAAASEVGACAYVTDIRMKPPVYGAIAAQGVVYARNTILSDARDAGANTVVFDPVTPGGTVYELHAVAYRC